MMFRIFEFKSLSPSSQSYIIFVELFNQLLTVWFLHSERINVLVLMTVVFKLVIQMGEQKLLDTDTVYFKFFE